MDEAEPQTTEKEELLPKFRMIPNGDIAVTEGLLNELAAKGYDLQAVSEKFMLMVLPTVSVHDEALGRVLAVQEQLFAERNEAQGNTEPGPELDLPPY